MKQSKILIVGNTENELISKLEELMASGQLYNCEIETESIEDEKKAVERAAEKFFDLMFIDIDALGTQKSVNFMKKIRYCSLNNNIKIIIMAAENNKEIMLNQMHSIERN